MVLSGKPACSGFPNFQGKGIQQNLQHFWATYSIWDLSVQFLALQAVASGV